MAEPASKGGAMGKWLLRLGGSLALLALLAWLLPLGDVLAGFGRVPLGLFLGTWLLFLAGHLVAAMKWRSLNGPGLSVMAALRAHVAGLAANLALPGAAGGDAVRAGLAYAALGDGPRAAAAGLVDRLVDLLALAALAVMGAAMLGSGQERLALWTLALLVPVMLAALYGAPPLLPWLVGRIGGLPGRGALLRLAAALQGHGRRPGQLLVLLVVSMAIQALFVWLTARLGQAIGVDLPLAAWFFAWPLAKILAVLPISLNGLGLREASLAALLVPLGAVGAAVVTTGLVWQGVLYLTGGLGALVLMLTAGGRPVPRAPDGTPAAAETRNAGAADMTTGQMR